MRNAVEHIKMGCWLEHMPYKPWYICSQRDVVEKSYKDWVTMGKGLKKKKNGERKGVGTDQVV